MEPIPSQTLHESTLPLPCARRLKGVHASFVVKKHWVWCCISFLSLPLKERFRKAVSKGLCFWCPESGHRAEVCQKLLRKYCRGRHHSLLHLEPVKSQPEEASSKSSESPSSSTTPPSSSSIVASSIAVNC